MARVVDIESGRDRVVLLVVAHADDPTLFLGGTVARWADSGWRVVVVRVTDDRWDSVGLDAPTTIARSRQGFVDAMRILGVAETIDLGYPTDTLGDVSEVGLREQIIRRVREHRPYALVTFDQFAMFGEDNEDHWKVAAATDEAFWTSQFDLHHPEHLADGLEPHGVFERWWFGRDVHKITDVVDITAVIDRKIDAALCHEPALRNFVHQLRLQARTGGWRIPLLDEVQDGDLRAVIDPLLRRQAQIVGARHGLEMAEEFRVSQFGGLGELLELFGERIEGEAT
jgi:LmbE family N-acetylglucosaminyl deacetylase